MEFQRFLRGITLVLLFFLQSNIAYSEHEVDVYGLFDKENVHNFDPYIQKIIRLQQHLFEPSQSVEEMQKIVQKQHILRRKIKNQWGYLYVNFDTVFYPESKKYYTTIEIIRREDSHRMHFVMHHPSNPSQKKLSPEKRNVIDDMIDYERIGADLVMSGALKQPLECPVHHCLWGFHEQPLRPYLALFNQAAHEHKMLIERSLQDPNPRRREAATYLLGHFTHAQEILTLLYPHVSDVDAGVRNSVMRVIGSTLEHANIKEIEITPFLEILDSPYVTDRNKALYVLLKAADLPSLREKILNKAGERLLDLLALKQPNNHDIAYLLLKKISMKEYPAGDLKKWRELIGPVDHSS